MTFDLPTIWAVLLAYAILVYVVLDGFDLGVGVLFGTTQNETFRSQMMASVAPVWDGNETWLIVVGAGLFAAFPSVYAILLPAFYIPLILLLAGLIFRGVAFEFRYKTERGRPYWDAGFFLGSLVCAFVQGAAVGAMVDGIAVENGQYAGGAFDWLTPFAVLCGLGLVIGYMLLGATWLILKTEGPLQEWAKARVYWLLGGVLFFLAIAFAYALQLDLRIMARWADRPILYIFPLLSLAGIGAIVWGLRKGSDLLPFAGTAALFLAAFGVMAFAFWPYMIPFTLTIQEAAAPPESLWFVLVGGGMVMLPVVTIYTAMVYWLFRGKVRPGESYH